MSADSTRKIGPAGRRRLVRIVRVCPTAISTSCLDYVELEKKYNEIVHMTIHSIIAGTADRLKKKTSAAISIIINFVSIKLTGSEKKSARIRLHRDVLRNRYKKKKKKTP